MKKVLFIDIGGVLVLRNQKPIIDHLLLIKEFRKTAYLGGKITLEEFLVNKGLNKDKIKCIVEGQNKVWGSEILNEKLISFLLLNKAKYRYILLTNNFKDVEVPLTKLNTPRFYEFIVNSAEVGYVKPDLRIYEYAVKRSGEEKENCILIDDNIENIKGAIDFGIKGIHYKNINSLKELS